MQRLFALQFLLKTLLPMRELVQAVSGLFAGGAIGDEDRDAAMEAIIAAYWAAKKEKRGKSIPEDQGNE